MKRIDLNVDIAEGFPNDAALLKIVSSANLCCGAHAGSWELTQETARRCRESGVRVGIHPGFPDRGGMGRRNPSPDEMKPWEESLKAQVRQFMQEIGAEYVKPHGAWYNLLATKQGDAQGDWARRIAIEIAKETRLPWMVLGGSAFADQLKNEGIAIVTEGFADRAYTPEGTLVPRTQPGAVLSDPAQILDQSVRLAETVDSICLHGDTPGCVEFALRVREALEAAGFEVGV